LNVVGVNHYLVSSSVIARSSLDSISNPHTYSLDEIEELELKAHHTRAFAYRASISIF
jgi:hypothetical protein